MTDAEYKTICDERNAAFKKRHGLEMIYEDVIKSFGGTFVGESLDTGKRNPQSRSSDDGII